MILLHEYYINISIHSKADIYDMIHQNFIFSLVPDTLILQPETKKIEL